MTTVLEMGPALVRESWRLTRAAADLPLRIGGGPVHPARLQADAVDAARRHTEEMQAALHAFLPADDRDERMGGGRWLSLVSSW